jgi:hypothetical protein
MFYERFFWHGFTEGEAIHDATILNTVAQRNHADWTLRGFPARNTR